jgi:hypothetical protein
MPDPLSINDPYDAILIGSAIRVYTALFPILSDSFPIPDPVADAIEMRATDIHEACLRTTRGLDEKFGEMEDEEVEHLGIVFGVNNAMVDKANEMRNLVERVIRANIASQQ